MSEHLEESEVAVEHVVHMFLLVPHHPQGEQVGGLDSYWQTGLSLKVKSGYITMTIASHLDYFTMVFE